MFKLLVYDFDGVMTDNKVYLDQNGKESVKVNRADGLAISEIKKLKIEQIILSSEKNVVVLKRAKKLGIHCLYGVKDKKKILLEYIKEKKIKLEEIGYIGNDINDLHVIEIVGYSFCPHDAHYTIKSIVNYVFSASGGDGVIRELLDFLNKSKET